MHFQPLIPEYFSKTYLILIFYFGKDYKVKRNMNKYCSHFRLKFTAMRRLPLIGIYTASFFQNTFRKSTWAERNPTCQEEDLTCRQASMAKVTTEVWACREHSLKRQLTHSALPSKSTASTQRCSEGL